MYQTPLITTEMGLRFPVLLGRLSDRIAETGRALSVGRGDIRRAFACYRCFNPESPTF
ncbi:MULTISPECIES: hypothetical protein [unclassified Anabaena]|uniref:hypothetical protein n=1 Tax=unclassified Anabaena TaxID=2619674 RepID=UPI000A61FCCF|nr:MULTISPECIES: hypothetical protein [unclassified Anabaena]